MLHMGDDKDGLAPVFRALEVSSVPVRIFRPTHVNRNEKLLEEGYEFLKRGGYIDLPAVCTLHRENVFWRLKSGDCPQSISQ